MAQAMEMTEQEMHDTAKIERSTIQDFFSHPLALILASAAVFLTLAYLAHNSPLRIAIYQRFKAANPKSSERKLNNQTKQALARAVGSLHHLIQVPLALYVVSQPDVIADRLRGSTPISTLFICISTGFFLYDLIDVTRNLKAEGPLYFVHAMSCFGLTFYASMAKKGHWYGGALIIWEVSMPFTQLRWYLAKIGLDHTPLYFWNGLLMITLFIVSRNIWGVAVVYTLFVDSSHELVANDANAMSPAAVYAARTGIMILNILNFYWGYKMLDKAYRVLVKGETQKMVGKDYDA